MDDSYTDSATRFNSKGAPLTERLDGSESLRHHYRRLSLHNREGRNGKWLDQQYHTRQDRQAIFDAIAGQLELTDHQRDVAVGMLEQLSASTHQGTATCLICLCVAALACREDGRHYHPDRSPENNDDTFDDVRRDLGFSKKHFRRCYHRIEGEVRE